MVRFSRKHRLARQELKHVWKQPQKIANKYGLVLIRTNHLGWPRIGIVIKKTSIKLACERNLVRRIIRESFRSYIKQLSGNDIIVLFSLRKILIDKQLIREEFNKLWSKISAIYLKSA